MVENKRRRGRSNIGDRYVARAPEDGYTLFMATIANTINPALDATCRSISPGISRRSTLVASWPLA